MLQIITLFSLHHNNCAVEVLTMKEHEIKHHCLHREKNINTADVGNRTLVNMINAVFTFCIVTQMATLKLTHGSRLMAVIAGDFLN